jgi:hypothetical protein
MGCLSSGNLKEGKVETTSFLTLVLWARVVKLRTHSPNSRPYLRGQDRIY